MEMAVTRIVLHGTNPVKVKRTERDERRVNTANAITFAEAAVRYIEAHKAGWRGDSRNEEQWRRSLALHHAAVPSRAIGSAHKILAAAGSIMILDLLQHSFERARELYGDRWLGFAESDLHRWLEGAGFRKIDISVVAREEQPPHFQTILAGGIK